MHFTNTSTKDRCKKISPQIFPHENSGPEQHIFICIDVKLKNILFCFYYLNKLFVILY